jgi:drug/metabolite transporter (DMT)-like permease
VLVSAATFGLMPIFAKLAYEQMNLPEASQVKTVLAIRFSIAAMCMWLLWAWQRRKEASGAVALRTSVIVPLIALGAVGYVGQSFSYFTALGIISASATGLLL